jgi:16S rRNA (guanine966-N2)-methyltransferase
MRIISGTHGGRRISPPTKMPYTRPTTDVAKEGLFNILNNMCDFEDLDPCLDLFGGTGCISYELASRGAKSITTVEKDTQMHSFIKSNIDVMSLAEIKLLKMDVFNYLEHCSQQFDFIFAGPPYALSTIDDLPRIVANKGLLASGGVFVLEHTPRNDYQHFELFSKCKNYGTTLFSFFVNAV